MPSVDLQGNPVGLGNPYIKDVGQSDSNAVIIYSGKGASGGITVNYQIRRRDQVPFFGGTSVLQISSSHSTSELIKEVNATYLKIVLPLRTNFQVRTRESNQNWTDWVNFKTKDNTYALPSSATQTRAERVDTRTGATVTVTNVGKSTVTPTTRGATVVNNDQGSNESLVNDFAYDGGNARARGRYIKNKTVEKQTATGVRIEGYKNSNRFNADSEA